MERLEVYTVRVSLSLAFPFDLNMCVSIFLPIFLEHEYS